MPLPATFDALLFDMDGTLIDSTPCVERIWRQWASEVEIDVEHLMAHMHGVRGVDVIARFAPHRDLQTEFEKLLQRELTDLDGTVVVAGLRERLAELADAPYAIVTSAPRVLAETKFDYCDLTLPAVRVYGEDVALGKPHPDPYLRGAALLGVDSRNCLAFEDAPNGIRSAKAAGMTVIALATSHTHDELTEADAVIADWHALHFVASPDGRVTVAWEAA
ncbi:MAG TPA: HAD-IA family hydrolase [Chitinolyticbacter sp.]|nr:HAD-IA family hydrolase [Chitinolyticbacter sp.]